MAYVGDALSEYPDVQPGWVSHISMAYYGDALSEYPVVLPGCVVFLNGMGPDPQGGSAEEREPSQ